MHDPCRLRARDRSERGNGCTSERSHLLCWRPKHVLGAVRDAADEFAAPPPRTAPIVMVAERYVADVREPREDTDVVVLVGVPRALVVVDDRLVAVQAGVDVPAHDVAVWSVGPSIGLSAA